MARNVTIGGSGQLFVGEDKQLILEVLDTDDVPVDMSGWTVSFVVRPKDNSTGTAILTKSASITGSYDATRADNTQRAVVTLSDTEMDLAPRPYRYSFKRTNNGDETILAWGTFTVEQATQV